ncbi:MAG: Helix-turn-helix domain [Segetibacter sp.]|nr:Helix-turn-helix domain [Segetibacter sp.]
MSIDKMKRQQILILVGANIQTIRKEKGIKGETLAKQLGISKVAISQMEAGLVDLKISTLCIISEVLNTPLTSLLVGEKTLESEFEDFRFKTEQHLRTINHLVCRLEFMAEQIEYMKTVNQKTLY